MKRAAFYTLGWANQYETEAMTEAFESRLYGSRFRRGCGRLCHQHVYRHEPQFEKIAPGDTKGKAEELHGRGAVGCYPQTAKEEVESMPEADIIVGTAERYMLPVYVEEFLKGKCRITNVGDIMKKRAFEGLEIERYKGRTRAFMKIQDGCSQFCSYCIIPYARGPVRSRPPEEVLREVRRLVEAGFREVVLTGIHITSYGRDRGRSGCRNSSGWSTMLTGSKGSGWICGTDDDHRGIRCRGGQA